MASITRYFLEIIENFAIESLPSWVRIEIFYFFRITDFFTYFKVFSFQFTLAFGDFIIFFYASIIIITCITYSFIAIFWTWLTKLYALSTIISFILIWVSIKNKINWITSGTFNFGSSTFLAVRCTFFTCTFRWGRISDLYIIIVTSWAIILSCTSSTSFWTNWT